MAAQVATIGPPVALLADTRLLWYPVREELLDSATTSDTTVTRFEEHRLIQSLVTAAVTSRKELETRQLRAAFVGALSGDDPTVARTFFDLARRDMTTIAGDADARIVSCRAGSMLESDRRWLEGADIVLVGGCVSAQYVKLFPDCCAPLTLEAGLKEMRSAGLFAALHTAQV